MSKNKRAYITPALKILHAEAESVFDLDELPPSDNQNDEATHEDVIVAAQRDVCKRLARNAIPAFAVIMTDEEFSRIRELLGL